MDLRPSFTHYEGTNIYKEIFFLRHLLITLRMSASIFPKVNRGNAVLAAASTFFGLKYVALELIQ
jgi:hypothetical protein